MQLRNLVLAAVFAIGCGTNNTGGAGGSGAGGGGGPVGGGGSPGVDGGVADAGSGADAGATVDAGTSTGPDAGGTADAGGGGGGSDGGTAASDCDGLVPPAPGAPAQFRLANQDLVNGVCLAAESDGTGHIAVRWQDQFQPHDSQYTFVDGASATSAGTFTGTNLALIGEASGFMGSECMGADCQTVYVVLGPTGALLYRSPNADFGNVQSNDPTGGMIHLRISSPSGPGSMFLDAIDAAGAVRWTRTLPQPMTFGGRAMLGADREGNVLAMWVSPGGPSGSSWQAQWYDHSGTAGSEFALPSSQTPAAVYERVGNGLFVNVRDTSASNSWLQIEPLATTWSSAPGWLQAQPLARLHMVHGGRGYAVLPETNVSTASCEQAVEIVSPSGQVCGSASFSVGGGSCTTSSIIVGYDGTVVQQLPREREAACTAAGHQCDCTYRYWAGYFR